MTSLAAQFGIAPDDDAKRDRFLGWQCRVRQMMMRDEGGRPNDAITPAVTLAGREEPMGHIITIMSKLPAYSVTPELTHMAKKTNDPVKWREEALRFFSSTYYQKGREFSDVLTACFQPGSTGAASLRAAEKCTLTFRAYGQGWDIAARVWKLSRRNPLAQATVAHNRLFNPNLHPDAEILGFEPDWNRSQELTP